MNFLPIVLYFILDLNYISIKTINLMNESNIKKKHLLKLLHYIVNLHYLIMKNQWQIIDIENIVRYAEEMNKIVIKVSILMPKLLVPTYFTFRVMCLKESLYYYGSIVNLSTDTAESYHSILKFHSLTTNNKDIYQQLILRELNSKSIIDIYQHSTNEYKYLLSLLNYEKYIYAKTKSIWIPNEYWKYINTKLPKYCYNYIKVNSIKENKENQQLIKQYKSINDQIITAYLQYYNINITKLNTDKIYFVNKFMQLNDKHEYIYNDMFVENKNSLEILQYKIYFVILLIINGIVGL